MIIQRKQHTIVVGGGKGGVGKSLISANLGVLMSQDNMDTLLVDADLGGANLHTLLGMSPPKLSLSEFIYRKASLKEVTAQTSYQNLSFISGAQDDIQAANLQHFQKMRLLKELNNCGHTNLLLDLGAGTAYNTLDLFLLASQAIVVVLPEPTSIENTYRFLKASFMRRLHIIQHVYGISELLKEIKVEKNKLRIHTPAQLIYYLKKKRPQIGLKIEKHLQQFQPWLIINQVDLSNPEEVNIGEQMSLACKRFFGIQLNVLGQVPYDKQVRRAVQQKKPVTLLAPQAPASLAIKQIFKKLSVSIQAEETIK